MIESVTGKDQIAATRTEARARARIANQHFGAATKGEMRIRSRRDSRAIILVATDRWLRALVSAHSPRSMQRLIPGTATNGDIRNRSRGIAHSAARGVAG